MKPPKVTGVVHQLEWKFNPNTSYYILDMNPLFVGMVYPGKTPEGETRWYGRILACKIVDLYENFEDIEVCKFNVVAVAQCMLINTGNTLKELSQELN